MLIRMMLVYFCEVLLQRVKYIKCLKLEAEELKLIKK